MLLTRGAQAPRRLAPPDQGLRGAALGGTWGVARVLRLEMPQAR